MYVGQHLFHAEDWGEEYHLFPARYTGNPVAVTGRSVGLPAILYYSPFFPVESYHSDGEDGVNIRHSLDYKNNCHPRSKFITKLQKIHTDLHEN